MTSGRAGTHRDDASTPDPREHNPSGAAPAPFDEQALHAEISALAPQMVADRRHLHAHPEVSLHEFNTAAFIKARLDELGIAAEPVGETGLLATLPGRGPGPTIMLRADIDALPLRDGCGAEWANNASEVNHACGHDGHIAALLAAARVLAGHSADFDGTIKFAFQQAEEIGAGGRIFEEAGALEGLDQVFGLHLFSGLPTGVVSATPGAQWASVDQFTIDVTGVGGHVSTPQLSHDALVAGASIVTEIQQIVARELSPFDEVVVGIGRFNSGENYNIIASSARLEGTVRAFDEQVREHVLASIERIAVSVAAAHQTTAEVRRQVFADVLSNDPGATHFAARVAQQILGVERVETNTPKAAMGDDFAVFLHHAPGVYARVGSGGAPQFEQPHHSYAFAINEASLPIAAELHASYALRWLAGGHQG
ncbi:Peptidase, M20/M25/M40 family [Propionibacterium freudenreichii]|uniref:M20 metallopeptidase family protein n=1 Tax=Propionibacterium freudenreichii TaxID=1744 RepID=UPI0005A5C945|nr:amidohydrolase [Propionibacterium freudenreichii]CEI28032.1 Peptidase, M20/M25/M40 family [Propionibacterium freudenreichii]